MAITLELPKFERLTGYSLDVIAGYDEVDDRRLWDLNVHNDTVKKYVVTGHFRKKIRTRILPPGVAVIDLNTGESIARTNTGDAILLSVGAHKLAFKKAGFTSKTRVLNINESFNQVLRIILDRSVTFSSTADDPAVKGDIGAMAVSIKANGKELLRTSRQTPFELSLPAVEHTVVFEKPGYTRKILRLSATSHSANVQLSPSTAILKIDVVDVLTNRPIPGAQVYYNSVENPQTLASFLVETNAEGDASGEMQPGTYTLKIRKPGYEPVDRMILANSGAVKLTFKLSSKN